MSNNFIGAKGNRAYMKKFIKNYRVTYLRLAEQHKVNVHIIK